jgi:hypothetical protein
MKMFLKVADFNRMQSPTNRVIYTDDKGLSFIGPEHEVNLGYTYVVECSTKLVGEKYYYIMKFIGEGKKLP